MNLARIILSQRLPCALCGGLRKRFIISASAPVRVICAECKERPEWKSRFVWRPVL